LFETASPNYSGKKSLERGRVFVLDADRNADDRIDIEDLRWTYLQGDGDFRSQEVTALRDEADQPTSAFARRSSRRSIVALDAAAAADSGALAVASGSSPASSARGFRDPLALDGVKEATLHRALRGFGNWEALEKLGRAALQTRSCPSAALLTALGQKSEEYFPEERFRTFAVALYSRSDECGGDDLSADKARYRLGLIHVWGEDCKKAEPLLERVSDRKGGDFVSRALYWRAFCSQQNGNKLRALAMKARLFKENPLSYHGLLLSRGESPASVSMPEARFRTEARPQLNTLVRAAELLQKLGATDLALELIYAASDQAEGTEGAFRLYVAVLAGRSGARLEQFKWISFAFQADPALISKPTLQLFYPVQKFDLVSKFSGRQKLDPYLVAALIRQ
jgi:hypothetical protein